MPPGLVGNPRAVDECDTWPSTGGCAPFGEITVDATANVLGLIGVPTSATGGVYSIPPDPSEPARLGIHVELPIGKLEQTLVDGFTAYFQLAVGTPDSWRLVFDAEHGADAMVTQRIERARRVASAGIAGLAEELLAAAGIEHYAARRAELEAHVLVATAEAAVRLMLTNPGVWTPEMLGRLLGHASAAAHSAYVETV
jgi:hypothetical protein